MSEEMETNADPAEGHPACEQDDVTCADLKKRIHASMASLMKSTRLVDVEGLLSKETVLNQQASMERKLRESAWNIIHEIDSHVTQEKAYLAQNVGIMQTLIKRFDIVQQMTNGSDKQNQLESLKIDLENREQCRVPTGMSIEFQPSSLCKQFMAGHMALGNINIRANKNLDNIADRSCDKHLDQAKLCGTGDHCTGQCYTQLARPCYNNLGHDVHACEVTKEECVCHEHETKIELNVRRQTGRKIRGSHGNQVTTSRDSPSHSMPSINVREVNDLHRQTKSTLSSGYIHVTSNCNCITRQCVEDSDSNASCTSRVSSKSSLIALDNHPLTETTLETSFAFKKAKPDQESMLKLYNPGPDQESMLKLYNSGCSPDAPNHALFCSKTTRDREHPENNLSGCGYVYREVWHPNIVHLPARSIDEMSFTWDSSVCLSSDNGSTSDNNAYPDSPQTGDSTARKEEKLSNVDLSSHTASREATVLSRQFQQEVTDTRENPGFYSKQTGRSHGEVLSCRFKTTFVTQHHRTPCVIPDITWLPDNRIVLADHYHNNVQLFDEAMNFVAEEPCSYPMGVCSVDKVKNVAAVTLRRAGSIAIFKAEKDRLRLLRMIDVKCEYYIWNVVYKSGHLFVVCDENNIHILDLNGREQSVIRSGVSTECGYIRYFDVSDDGMVMYLCTEKGLICLHRNGQHLWRFTMDQVPDKPITKYGQVLESVYFYGDRLLTTHWTGSAIIELSLDGRYVKHLVTDGLEHPRSMASRKGKLAVTQFNLSMKEKQKRTVKIFDLIYE